MLPVASTQSNSLKIKEEKEERLQHEIQHPRSLQLCAPWSSQGCLGCSPQLGRQRRRQPWPSSPCVLRQRYSEKA